MGKKNKKTVKKQDMQLVSSYTGPYTLPSDAMDVITITVNKSYGFSDQTSVSGILTNSFKSSDVVNCADWSSVQSTWKDFRVLAFELEFVPVNAVSSSGITVVLVRDHTPGASPLTSMTQGLAFDNHCLFSSSKLTNTKFGIKAATVEELQFQQTSGSTAFFAIQSYSTAGSISTTYFFVNMKFVLQLRGMK